MKNLLAVSLLIVLASCAGNSASVDTGNASFVTAGDTQADTTDDFDVTVEQTNAPMAMPAASDTRTPVAPLDIKYAISITNHTKDPVTLRHITMSTPEGPFALQLITRNYKQAIAPGASATVDFWARAEVRDAHLGAATPALVRTMIQFEGPQGKRTESFMRNVNGRFGAGIG